MTTCAIFKNLQLSPQSKFTINLDSNASNYWIEIQMEPSNTAIYNPLISSSIYSDDTELETIYGKDTTLSFIKLLSYRIDMEHSNMETATQIRFEVKPDTIKHIRAYVK